MDHLLCAMAVAITLYYLKIIHSSSDKYLLNTYYKPESVLGPRLNSNKQNRQKSLPCRNLTQAIVDIRDTNIYIDPHGILGGISDMEKKQNRANNRDAVVGSVWSRAVIILNRVFRKGLTFEQGLEKGRSGFLVDI